MKKCKDCGLIKDESEFYGVQGECKECTKKRVRKYSLKNKENIKAYEIERNRNCFDRIFKHRYYSMVSKFKGKASHKSSMQGKKIMSKKEFLDWCYERNNFAIFSMLHFTWATNNYCRKLAPSIDRIDNSKSYIKGNIRWITQQQNSSKYTK